MDRIVDFDAVDHGDYWTFEPLTLKARAFIEFALPKWPRNHGIRTNDPAVGKEIVQGLLSEGMEVNVNGRRVSPQKH